MTDRNQRDGRTVFPYRNIEDERPSTIREWLDAQDGGPDADVAERVRLLRASIDAVRADDTPRTRAVLALAEFDAESVGYAWDALPWSSGTYSMDVDQRYYVMHAISRVDYLVEHGLVKLP
jgi:hypothetical protein